MEGLNKRKKPIRCRLRLHSWYYITPRRRVCKRCGKRQTEKLWYDGLYWDDEDKDVEWYPTNLEHVKACVDVCHGIGLSDLVENKDELNELVKAFIKFKGEE